MSFKLLTEHNLKSLSLKGGCNGLSESTLVKMPHCWKSHVTAHITQVDRMSRSWRVLAIHYLFYLFIQYLKRCTLLAEIAILPSGPL